MSSLSFQLYHDPENVNLAQPNKNVKTGGLPSFKREGTPRKALKDWNASQPSIGSQHTHQTFKKPVAPAPKNVKSHKPQETKSRKTQVVEPESAPCPWIDDDIEFANVVPPEPDDYEDVLPKSERITAYLSALINWRPTCLRGDDSFMDKNKTEIDEEDFSFIDNLPELDAPLLSSTLSYEDICPASDDSLSMLLAIEPISLDDPTPITSLNLSQAMYPS